MKTYLLIFAYLIAIVLANLSITHFGPSSAVVNAFLLIGLDLTCRDALHERWTKNRFLKLLGLIVVGSALSWLMNKDAGKIALASCVAFLLSGLTDTAVYTALFRSSKFKKINISNMFAAVIDSFVFVFLAFGLPFLWPIVLLQIAAKIVGGYIWSWVIFARHKQLAV